MTAGGEGPVCALWVVLAPQFELRWEATPQGHFLRLSSSALHFGRLGHRERKPLTRISARAQAAPLIWTWPVPYLCGTVRQLCDSNYDNEQEKNTLLATGTWLSA